MADLHLRLRYGQESNLGAVAVENGTLRVTTDSQKLFADVGGVRLPLGEVVTSYTAAQILAITAANALPKIYMSSDTLALYWFDTAANDGAGEWKQVGANVALADRATADGSGNVITSTYETKADALDKFNNLAAQLAAINSFEIRLLSSASDLETASHASNIIYFVPGDAIQTNPDANVYDEYIWVVTTPANPDANPPVAEVGRFEKIGTTETDLTNYYTKSEFDSIVGSLDPTAANYVTIDGRISEIVAQLGTYAASTDNDFTSVEDRFTADEAKITEIEGKFGAFNDTTATGFQTVEQRFTTDEAVSAEINAKLGNMKASTDNDFVSVEDRLTTLETDTAGADAVAEINAKLGDYADSTDDDFVSVEDRFGEIEAKIGNMAASSSQDFQSIEERLVAEETATGRLDAEIGALDPTVLGYRTVAQRLDATEANDAELAAQLGNLDSTAQDYVTVADRLTATEAADAELAAQLGNLDSTAQDYVTVADRLTAEEAATTRIDGEIDSIGDRVTEVEAQLGNLDSTAQDYVTVADRLTALETDTADADAVAEINAKLGNMKASTDNDFVSVEDRLQTTEANDAELAAQLGNLDSTAQDYVTVADRLTAEETATSRLDAEIGALDPTAQDYVTVADRLTATEAADAELAAQLGNLDSTAQDYVTVADRLDAAETGISEIEAKFGTYAASSAQGFVAVENRFTTDENNIYDLQQKVGLDYPAPGSAGFKSVNTRLSELVTAIGNVNKFDIQVVQQLPATTAGESYVIYFVPIEQGADNNNGHTQYVEYMWIKTSADDEPVDGYYEEIGITEADLSEYYKASEVDAKLGTYDATTISTKGTVQARLDELEAKFGAYAASSAVSGFVTVESRFSEIEAKIGNMDASTSQGFQSIEDRLDATEANDAELAAQLGNLDSTAQGYVTVADRLDAAESDLAEIHAEIGNLDSTVQGYQTLDSRISAIEGGAVTQSEDTDDAQKPVLVSGGNNNDEVEYVPGVTVNANDNSITGDIGNLETVNSTDVNTTNVTATTATAQEVVLGDATLTFDSNTGALVINF